MKKRLFNNIFYPTLALSIFLAVWAIISEVKQVPLVLPQIDVIFNKFFYLLIQKNTWQAVLGTFNNVIITFSISLIISLLFSIINTIIPIFHKILMPINTIIRTTPTIVVILLSILWLSYKKVPIFIGFLIAYPLLYSSFKSIFSNIDKQQLEMATTFKISKLNQIKYIFIPNVLPKLLDSCQSVISLTVKVVIASEILANVGKTIGYEIELANSMIETDVLLAYTILAILLSFVLELIFAGLKKLAEVKYGY